MLIGRDREREHIRAAIEAARRGRGTALVVRGEPGIGKTALLEQARRDAGGIRVLAARGIASESRLAFAGLADLLRPVLDRIDRVPGAQQAALRAALALGPPAAPDRFAAYAATLSLLGALASEGPLLVVVDDAHWLDAPSREALAFCARRIADEPVAILAASRERPPERVEVEGLDELVLTPLDDDDARDLLGSLADGERLAPAVASEILAIARGNPLALLQLPRALSADERTGRAALPRPLRAGEAIARAYRRRIEALGAGARRALVIAAVGDDGAVGSLTAALAAGGGSAGDLAEAEAAGVLVLDGDVARLTHPLLRPVVLELTEARDRREAHRALAGALDPERDAERRAWHLAEAAVGPDEEAAAALEGAAMRAAARTGYATAASTLEQAARMSAAPQAASARRVMAAKMAMAAGQFDRARALLGEEQADGAATGPEAGHLRGLLLMMTSSLDAAYELLVREGERIAPAAPAQAAAILADAVLTRTMAGECEQALTTARRAYSLAGSDPAAPPSVLAYLAGALVLRGNARAARPLMERFDAATAAIDPVSPAGQMLVIASGWRSWIGDYEVASAAMDRWIELGRESGALGFVAFPLTWAVEIDFRMGRWTRARARGEEAIALLSEGGNLAPIGYAMCTLGLVEAGLGMSQSARERALLAREAGGRQGVHALEAYADAIMGFVALGEGDPETARRELQLLPAHAERFGLAEPATVMWQPDLVEADARLGLVDAARRTLATLAEQADRTGGSWGRAVTCRCRGLIGDDIDRHFGEALSWHERDRMPFERARTELAYGSRLRRAGRRTEAREQLERALATFEDLGARPWARQAREELAAGGARLRPRARDAVDELTPRELQVATAVAEGLTNREVAARLFLSEKTIERHLGSVYRKLGLRSRTELAARVAREGVVSQ